MKEKLLDFLKRIPTKIYLFLILIVSFGFLSNDFGLIDIQKTAIILAMGLDREEDGFTVTAQISVPKPSKDMGGSTSVEIVGKGKTVSDGISDVYAQTGWVPKLIFCNLILIGEETAKENIFDALDFFLRYDYMPDNCLVAVCEGRAEKMISEESAIDDASSFALEKLFSQSAEKSGSVCDMTLREFAIGYYGPSNSGYMPFVTAQTQDPAQTESGGGGGGESGEEQGGNQASEKNKSKVFFATETALFSQGKMVGKLSKEQSFAVNILQGKVFSGTFDVKEEDRTTSITVYQNSGSVSLDMKGTPTVTLSVSVVGRISSGTFPSGIAEIAASSLPKETELAAARTLEQSVRTLWETTRDCGCDLFRIKTSLFRSSAEKYEEWQEILLSVATPEFEVSVKSSR